MQYMGSKNRIAKEILPIMLKERKEGQYWVEPFVGGANMIDKVDGKRIGADSNKYVIEGLISIRDCLAELPKNNLEFTESHYKELRKDDSYKHKGYISFAISFGGKFMGGYSKNKKGDDYVARAYRQATKQSPQLQDVELINSYYDELVIPDNSIIYCDPPYENTTAYKDKFNHSKFWQWCREMVNKGHTVFISEYNAPDDFECIKEIKTKTVLNKNSQDLRIEKLFKHKSQL